MASGEQSWGAQHHQTPGASATGHFALGLTLRTLREAGEVLEAEPGSGRVGSSQTLGVICKSQQPCGALPW